MSSIQEQLDALRDDIAAERIESRALVLLGSAALVFFMNTGYAMIHVGSVQLKNTKNVLITNVFDSAFASLIWWLVGFGIAFGDSNDTDGLIGTNNFALAGDYFRGGTSSSYSALNWSFWFFHWAVACTTVTITAGAVAERITWPAYAMYSAGFLCLIYPVVVYWGWSADGWASPHLSSEKLLLGCGVIDHAGSGVVHVTGGIAAFIGSLLLGSRHGRFIEGIPREFPKASWVYQTLGTLILWFGWFGMIIGIGFGHDNPALVVVVARAMVNAAISAGTSCLVNVLLYHCFYDIISTEAANNGILSGLVAISAGCTVVNPEGAFLIGLIGGLCYFGGVWLILALGIDDVVNASPVHLFAGIWGLLAPGFFATKSLYSQYFENDTGRENSCCGVFYGCGGKQLGASLAYLGAILAWTGILTGAIFLLAKATVGLRIPTEVEDAGMDLSKHGGYILPATETNKPVDFLYSGTERMLDEVSNESNANREAAKASARRFSGLGTSGEGFGTAVF